MSHDHIILYLSLQAVVLWLISVITKDSSLFDRVWGSSFVVICWLVLFSSTVEWSFGVILYTAMVTLWGLRLSWHITSRNLGKGEDRRYASIRNRYSHYEIKSFFMVFVFQSILVWVVALPIIYGLPNIENSNLFFQSFGFMLWCGGFVIEVTADRQLKTFIKNRESHLDVCDHGLWAFSRHPNYLGDAILWWGLCLYVFSWPIMWILISPMVMTYLLRFFTGIGPLEEDQCEKKIKYKEYQERVPIFFPKLVPSK